MDASASADGVAARLEALQEQCACWTLESDRQLLHVLQEMSQELLASLDGCRAAADSVSSEAGAAAVRVAATASQFRLLSHTRFIQQRTASVAESLPRRERREAAAGVPAAPAGDPDEARSTPQPAPKHWRPTPAPTQAAQVASSLQAVPLAVREALQAATAALLEPAPSAPPRPLPYLFGSSEYLQDPHGGLGPLIPGWRPPAPVGADVGSERSPADAGGGGAGPDSGAAAAGSGRASRSEAGLAEGFGDGLGEGSEDGRALPDFQSMLEAALRGDLGGDPEGFQNSDRLADAGRAQAPPAGARHSANGGGRADAAGALGARGAPAAQPAAAEAPAKRAVARPSAFQVPAAQAGAVAAAVERGGGQGAEATGPAHQGAHASTGASDDLVFGASEDGDSWAGADCGERQRAGPGQQAAAMPGGLFDEEEALDLEALRGGGSPAGAAGEARGAALEGLGSGALQELGSSSLHLDDAELLASLRALTGSRA